MNGDGMFYCGMGKFGRSWWRFNVHSPYLSYHPPLGFFDARKTQNERSLEGFRYMVQVFTDVLLAHVCVFVCCLLHESIVGCDMFQVYNGIYK